MGRAIGVRALAGGHEIRFVGTHIGKARELADEMVAKARSVPQRRSRPKIVVLAVPYTEARTWSASTPTSLRGR